MNYIKIHQKNINGLTLFGEFLPKSPNSFQEILDYLFQSIEALPLESFELQIYEDNGKLTRLVKMSLAYVQMNFNFYSLKYQ